MSAASVHSEQQGVATSNIEPPKRPVRSPLIFNDPAMTSPFGSGAWSLYGTRVDGEKSTHMITTVPDSIGLAYATCLLKHLLKDEPESKDLTITWLLSAFSALYPDEGMSVRCNTARFVRNPLDPALVTYLKGEAVRDSGRTQADPNDPTRQVAIMEADLDPRTVDGVEYSLDAYTLHDLTALLSVGLYVIVKEPNDDNITAFTDRRRKALIRQMRLDTHSVVNDLEKWWKLKALQKIHSAFNVYMSARIGLVTELVSWKEVAVTDKRFFMWGQLRLWERHGMVPMEAMSAFVASCQDMILAHPTLYDEAKKFILAKSEFDRMTPHEKSFKKTIEGALYTPLPINELNNLLGAAVAYGKQASKSFGNYKGGKMAPTIEAYVLSTLKGWF